MNMNSNGGSENVPQKLVPFRQFVSNFGKKITIILRQLFYEFPSELFVIVCDQHGLCESVRERLNQIV